jgi:hypothetical protein
MSPAMPGPFLNQGGFEMKPKTLSHRHPPTAAVLAAALALLLLGACVPHRPPAVVPDVDVVVPACHASLCNITDDTWQNHIDPRHCTGTCPPKSLFAAAYCGSRANAVAFCLELMSRPNCQGAAQPNGRIAYTATLAGTVGSNRNNGCANTVWGTVIYDPGTDEVVTQFPGTP